MAWTLDYEDDIASDLSAFHRIDDPMTLDGPRYFMLAERLPAYAGVLQARLMAERSRSNDGAHAPQAAAPVASRQGATPAAPQAVPEAAMLATLGPSWVEHTTTEGD